MSNLLLTWNSQSYICKNFIFINYDVLSKLPLTLRIGNTWPKFQFYWYNLIMHNYNYKLENRDLQTIISFVPHTKIPISIWGILTLESLKFRGTTELRLSVGHLLCLIWFLNEKNEQDTVGIIASLSQANLIMQSDRENRRIGLSSCRV